MCSLHAILAILTEHEDEATSTRRRHAVPRHIGGVASLAAARLANVDDDTLAEARKQTPNLEDNSALA
jgi:hypothetical protein